MYLCVYTTHTPPCGPCPCLCMCAHTCVCGACVGALCASCVRHSAMCVACEPKLAAKLADFCGLPTVMVSVAMSSGTCEAATWQGDAKTAVPMHIICYQIPYPISGWWLSNLGHLVASCTRTSSAHELRNNLLFL